MLDWGRLKPEERVDLAVNMSSVCIRVCIEGVKSQHPNISEEKLMELVRERLMYEKNLRRGRRKSRPKIHTGLTCKFLKI